MNRHPGAGLRSRLFRPVHGPQQTLDRGWSQSWEDSDALARQSKAATFHHGEASIPHPTNGRCHQ